MRISTLECFVFLSDIGSFHAAARTLNLSQPALSRRISKLEEELGTTLIDRSQKAVVLTPTGREFLESAQEIVSLAGKAIERTREVGHYSGRNVSIGAIPSVLEPVLIPSLLELKTRFRSVRTSIHEANSERVVKFVSGGKVDFGIGISMSRPAGVRYERLYSEPLCLVCCKEHALTEVSLLDWKILEKYPVSFNATTSGNWFRIQSALKSRNVYPDWQYECRSLHGVLSFVAQGAAIAIAPASLATSELSGSLRFFQIEGDPIEREVGMFYNSAALSQNLSDQLAAIVRSKASSLTCHWAKSE
jgi:DNA-binding transcriptional LysR family regulator